MPELLLELGCEELPASFVRKALDDLRSHVESLLSDHGILGDGAAQCFATPRRLIVSFPNILPRQADRDVDQRGPALQAAYDAQGQPTPALVGFCRGQGVDPSSVRKDDKYVWITRHVAGKPSAEVLQEALPQAIRSLAFEKSMRWGSRRLRFARPIRWVLAAFDGQGVPFELEGVHSGTRSRGHRFYRPEEFEANTLDQLLKGLRDRFVEPDPDIRKKNIVGQAESVASGTPEITGALLEENVFLTEWPTAVEGAFRDEFMDLPQPVLVTAMAKHERFFPIRNQDGSLTNRFVSIRNGGEDDTVRRGNEWVLNARFNDAKFFFEEDRKYKLAEFLEKTSGILFQDRLGTVRQRADRLSHVAAEVARKTHADEEEIELARLAGLYCKADLSTGLVSELASLQGVIGGEYARREGFPDPVCWAIATHYDLGKNSAPQNADSRAAVRVLIADQLDKLAGCLGLGMEPTGSSDPNALRRAATLLIEAAWNWPGPFGSYVALMQTANQAFMAQGVMLDGAKALASLGTLFASRYEALLSSVRHDVLEASILESDLSQVLYPQAVRFRVACVTELSKDESFVHTATRPANILAAAQKKGVAVGEPSRLDSTEGDRLLSASIAVQSVLDSAYRAEDSVAMSQALRSLMAPINAFFDSTMIMADDADVRSSRLGLLQRVNDQIRTAGDFTKIVIEG